MHFAYIIMIYEKNVFAFKTSMVFICEFLPNLSRLVHRKHQLEAGPQPDHLGG